MEPVHVPEFPRFLELHDDVIGLVIENVEHRIDRVNLIISCKKLYAIYIKEVRNKRVRDHRPTVAKIHSRIKKLALRDDLKGKECSCVGKIIATGVLALIGAFIGGLSPSLPVSIAAQKLLVCVGHGTCYAGSGALFVELVCAKDCMEKDADQAAQLSHEVQMEEKSIQEELEALNYPRIRMDDDYASSYQLAQLKPKK